MRRLPFRFLVIQLVIYFLSLYFIYSGRSNNIYYYDWALYTRTA